MTRAAGRRRLHPMPGRGRHGAYPRSTNREALAAIGALTWGLLLHPFEKQPEPWRYDS